MSRKRSYHSSCRCRRPSLSCSTRAELQFSVSLVDRLLREGNYAQRLNLFTPIFLAGILKYLAANILELAGNEAYNNHRIHITPEHVERAVDNDPQLSLLIHVDASDEVDEIPQSKKN
ncbi:histone H2A-beta, sperm-like [Trichechus manatus latirostris]|uniref:Histone H2A n=1 Tax=Trichechus manatus latirostris TaxID=127582 RepID=A0A2Y9ED88_TRIMA|nr:histone H2A-beta, sperm-like [Trichechus manatus latirostris]